MAAGLIQHAFAGVDQQDRQIAGRCAGRHVTRVLLVPWRVGNNKFAFLGREIAVCHINGNSLLALSLQPVDQQRQIEFFTLGAMTLTVVMQRRELIFINLTRIVQQSANQRAFTVIDAAAGQEAQQAFCCCWATIQASTPPSLAICCASVVFMAAP